VAVIIPATRIRDHVPKDLRAFLEHMENAILHIIKIKT